MSVLRSSIACGVNRVSTSHWTRFESEEATPLKSHSLGLRHLHCTRGTRQPERHGEVRDELQQTTAFDAIQNTKTFVVTICAPATGISESQLSCVPIFPILSRDCSNGSKSMFVEVAFENSQTREQTKLLIFLKRSQWALKKICERKMTNSEQKNGAAIEKRKIRTNKPRHLVYTWFLTSSSWSAKRCKIKRF